MMSTVVPHDAVYLIYAAGDIHIPLFPHHIKKVKTHEPLILAASFIEPEPDSLWTRYLIPL